MSPEFDLFLRFATAMAIGFLIGVQREISMVRKDRSIIAGERTTSLLSLGGAVAAMLAEQFQQPMILVTFMLLSALFAAIGYFGESWQRERIGITSEVAILKREVSFLNAVIVWLKSGGQSTSAGPRGPSA